MLIDKTYSDRHVSEKTRTEQLLSHGIQSVLPDIFRERIGLTPIRSRFADVYEFRHSNLLDLISESIGIRGGSYGHLNRDDFSESFQKAISIFFADLTSQSNSVELNALCRNYFLPDYKDAAVVKYHAPDLELADLSVAPPKRTVPVVQTIGHAAVATYESGIAMSRQLWDSLDGELFSIIQNAAIDVVDHDKKLIAQCLTSAPEINEKAVFTADNRKQLSLDTEALAIANSAIGGGAGVLIVATDLYFTALELNKNADNRLTVIELPELTFGNWFLTTNGAVLRLLIEGQDKPVILYHRSKNDDRSEIYFRREVGFILATGRIFNGYSN